MQEHGAFQLLEFPGEGKLPWNSSFAELLGPPQTLRKLFVSTFVSDPESVASFLQLVSPSQYPNLKEITLTLDYRQGLRLTGGMRSNPRQVTRSPSSGGR